MDDPWLGPKLKRGFGLAAAGAFGRFGAIDGVEVAIEENRLEAFGGAVDGAGALLAENAKEELEPREAGTGEKREGVLEATAVNRDEPSGFKDGLEELAPKLNSGAADGAGALG